METCISQGKLSSEAQYGLLIPSQTLEQFLDGLSSSVFDGFCTILGDKIASKVSPLSFEKAKQIHRSLIQKNSLKEKKNWKNDQISLLFYLVDKSMLRLGVCLDELPSEAWETIGNVLQNRTGQCCQQKALSLAPSSLNQRPWSQEEQEKLSQIIQKEGSTHWKRISLKLFQANSSGVLRTSKQCRERYMCFMQPKLKKGFWTQSEDLQLINLFLEHGRKWSKIAQSIEGRNENAIKNRFFLLFEEPKKGEKIYYSEFMRRILRRKEKLQKIPIEKTTQNTTFCSNENQFTDIEKFLSI